MKKQCCCIFIITIIFLTSFIYNQCTSQTERTPQNIPFELKVKNDLLSKHKPQKSWIALKIAKETPMSVGEENDIYFVNPSDITVNNSGQIYCVDNILSTIYKFSSNGTFIKRIGRKGQGPGELNFPSLIDISRDNNLFVYQGTKLSVFSPIDSFLKNIKIESRFNDFLLIDGSIYANCLYNDNEDHPLIEVFNLEGEQIDFLGKRLNISGHWNRDSMAFIDGYEKKIFTAFKHHPIIRTYSRHGDLFNEFKIDLNIMNKLEELNYDPDFNNEKPAENPIPRLPRVLAGLKVHNNHIYVLLHLPRPEILEFTFDGELSQYYYCDDMNDVLNYGNGFIVTTYNDTLRFGIIHSTDAKIYYLEPEGV